MKGRSKKGARRKSYRRRSRVGALPTMSNVTGTLINGASVLGGYAIAGKVKGISFLANNSIIGNLAVIAAGALTPMLLKNSLGSSLGIGMAMRGVQGLIVDNAPGISETLGIAGLESQAPIFSMMNGLDNQAPVNSYIGEGIDSLRIRMR